MDLRPVTLELIFFALIGTGRALYHTYCTKWIMLCINNSMHVSLTVHLSCGHVVMFAICGAADPIVAFARHLPIVQSCAQSSHFLSYASLGTYTHCIESCCVIACMSHWLSIYVVAMSSCLPYLTDWPSMLWPSRIYVVLLPAHCWSNACVIYIYIYEKQKRLTHKHDAWPSLSFRSGAVD